ncbi:MAG: hypothetical protein ACW98X_23905 [Promethearchaeota archaeon]
MKTNIKLKLKIKDVEIELTKSEIKELKSILDEIFPQKEIVREYWPYYPYRWYRQDDYQWSDTTHWTVTSDNTANALTVAYN